MCMLGLNGLGNACTELARHR